MARQWGAGRREADARNFSVQEYTFSAATDACLHYGLDNNLVGSLHPVDLGTTAL